MKLTAKTIAALSLGDRADVIHFDDEMAGFGYRLRRGAGGKVRRSWIVQYRRAGASRRVLLGTDVLSPEQARLAAKKVLATVQLGEDPQAERSERRSKDKLSFRSVAAEYIEAKRDELRPASLRHTVSYLTRPQYFRALWAMPLDQVTRKEVAAQLLTIARQSGRPTAHRARSVLSAFFTWAMKMGLVDHNPVIGTAQPKANPPRDRVLNDPELAAIWNAADGADDFSRIVRLLILLPCRRQEVGGMAWGELDGAVWTIPSTRTKNGRSIVLPLMPEALAIIASVPHRVGRDQLFGSHHAGGFCAWHTHKRLLDGKLAIAAWNVHDIRRSVATRMADLGVAPHVIEQLLNHQSGHKAGVAGIYNRSSYEREVRAALALWADHIRALAEGGARKILSFGAAGA